MSQRYSREASAQRWESLRRDPDEVASLMLNVWWFLYMQNYIDNYD